MANQPAITVAVANAMLDALGVLADSGKLRFYNDPKPAGPGTAISTQTLLAEATMNADAFPAAANNQLTANAITQDSSIDASGTATWARLWKSDGTTALIDLTVGTAGCDINMANNVLVAGGTLSVTSLTITLPLI
jgi:hypothetical protein